MMLSLSHVAIQWRHLEKELLDGVEVVTAGIVELIERQLRGYIYIRP